MSPTGGNISAINVPLCLVETLDGESFVKGPI